MKKVVSAFLFLSSVLAFADSKVDQDLKVYDEHVQTLKDDFSKIPEEPSNKEWIKLKLQHMVDVDQYMRSYGNVVYDHNYTDAEKEYFWKQFFIRWSAVDTRNTNELKVILLKFDWITVSDFGVQADRNAWLLVQHADHDPQFQSDVLKKLEPLCPKGETNPANYAYLYDRVAASWNDTSKQKPQRYGTQGTCVGPGKWEPIPIEDPDKVDERRASVGLGPLSEYIAGFKDICK